MKANSNKENVRAKVESSAVNNASTMRGNGNKITPTAKESIKRHSQNESMRDFGKMPDSMETGYRFTKMVHFMRGTSTMDKNQGKAFFNILTRLSTREIL